MESVQNAAKHSGSAYVSVRLVDGADRWRLSIVDQGAGFDSQGVAAPGAGVGLVNMRDRLDAVGGTLSVESQPGLGTTVTAEVPRIPNPRVGGTLSPSPLPAV
jgi:signal transduction histidine kinase